jgi:L-fuculose-phosphate aldolase
VVHCHPPHATAFAIAREPIPQCVLPEVEVFLGDVPITRYETPGGKAFAETILPFVDKTNVIILANHGTVSYGLDVEQAFWWTEILDAYCRMLMLARQLGNVSYFTENEERELLTLKQKWGWSDPRNTEEYKNCDVCANDIFRNSWKESGVQRRAFPAPPPMPVSNQVEQAVSQSMAGIAPVLKSTSSSSVDGLAGIDQEQLIKLITAQVMKQLQG